jgi:hypothetical protein
VTGGVVLLASEAYEPNDAVGLAGLFIIGLPALISAVLAGLALWRQQVNARKVDDVAAGVRETNRSAGHCLGVAPMRGDIDEMRSEMQAGFRQMTRDIGGLREEIRTERTERIEGDKRSL